MTPYGVIKLFVNIGSGNGLLPDCTRSLPKQMLTEGNWTGNRPDEYPWYELENYQFNSTATSLRAQMSYFIKWFICMAQVMAPSWTVKKPFCEIMITQLADELSGTSGLKFMNPKCSRSDFLHKIKNIDW